MSSQLNADLGEDYKDKLREIADSQERNMTSQIRFMIDNLYEELFSEEA
jgi:hypothetical protein